MQLKDIETADCPIEFMAVSKERITIRFSYIFDVGKEKYVSGAEWELFNWSAFAATRWIPENVSDAYVEEDLSWSQLEFFAVIQHIEEKNQKIILQGFSRQSGYWMQYVFHHACYTLVSTE